MKMDSKDYKKEKHINYDELPDGVFKGAPKTTLSNLAFLLDANGIECRYNVIKKGLELSSGDRRVSINEVLSLAQFHEMETGNIPA